MGPKTVIFALLFLTACASGAAKDVAPAPIADPKQIWCDHNEPRRFNPEARAAMTDQEKREALEFNLQGAEWCGWKA